MLTRVYIDNYLCFVNFEYRPERTQLIFGRNGSGKSSFVDAVMAIRQFAVSGEKASLVFPLNSWTRWSDLKTQTFEIEARLDNKTYVYRLALGTWGDPVQPRVQKETVSCDSKTIFEFIDGEVHLFNDRFEHKVTYPFDWYRSAFETISPRQDNTLLTRFKSWFGALFCFKINPYSMDRRTEGEEYHPNVNLSNFASWYRHLLPSDPKKNSAMLEDLGAALDSFSFLHFDTLGENAKALVATFDQPGGEIVKFGFHELSDGQRCLICLYAILRFLVANGNTIILDEPDNFISSREIQPWLMTLTDAVESGSGQVLIISHHPEILNQWGPGSGVRFVRDGVGPCRAIPFVGPPGNSISLSELIASGWEND